MKYVTLAPMVICKDAAHLDSFFQDVIDKGGEGIILRDPVAPYHPGRSPGYLKHKVGPLALCAQSIALTQNAAVLVRAYV